jgi:hypothetical protein
MIIVPIQALSRMRLESIDGSFETTDRPPPAQRFKAVKQRLPIQEEHEEATEWGRVAHFSAANRAGDGVKWQLPAKLKSTIRQRWLKKAAKAQTSPLSPLFGEVSQEAGVHCSPSEIDLNRHSGIPAHRTGLQAPGGASPFLAP